MISIFTIERRKNFQESFEKFLDDLQKTITTSSNKCLKINDYLNYCIRYWPHRCGAISIQDYLCDIEIDISYLNNERDMLLALELYINLLHWAPKQDFQDSESDPLAFTFKKNDVENESDRLLQNIAYMLEQCCNMVIRKADDESFPKYHISKRNAYVDAAIVVAPELSEVLLGYFDIRNEDDLEYKKAALNSIYGYLEPRRTEFKKYVCSSISEEFFAGMNNFGIRHNTKAQVKMQTKKKKSVCDMLFMLAVYVLQTPVVLKYKDSLKEMRDKK